MSILIKGMKMPKEITPDVSIEFAVTDTGKTYARFHYPPDLSDIRGLIWFPVIELPPHGRLIDADVLKAAICEALKNALDDDYVNIFGAVLAEFVAQGFTDEIESAPTIIEAEEEAK